MHVRTIIIGPRNGNFVHLALSVQLFYFVEQLIFVIARAVLYIVYLSLYVANGTL
jgi:hypothetical protein